MRTTNSLPRPRPSLCAVDRAAVHFDDPLHEREADAEAAARAPAGAIGLAEHVEHPRQHLRVDAHAGVRDADHGLVAVAAEGDRDRLARLAVLCAVVQQVGEHLREPRAVGVARRPAAPRRVTVTDCPAVPSTGSLVSTASLIAAARSIGSQRRLHLAGRDARDVEQVVDQPHHLARPGAP